MATRWFDQLCYKLPASGRLVQCWDLTAAWQLRKATRTPASLELAGQCRCQSLPPAAVEQLCSQPALCDCLLDEERCSLQWIKGVLCDRVCLWLCVGAMKQPMLAESQQAMQLAECAGNTW